MNKKGLSQVVTVILILLLVLAAVAIIWRVVGGVVRKGAETAGEKASCIGITLSLKNVGCNISLSNVTGIVSRDADNGDLTDVKIIVGNNIITSTEGGFSVPEPLGSVQFANLMDEDNTMNEGDLVMVKVAPVVGEGITCDTTDEVTVKCVS